VKLMTGFVFPLKTSCAGTTFIEKVRISTVEPIYSLSYQYTSGDFAWTSTSDYSCASGCTPSVCPQTPPIQTPFFYTQKDGIATGANTSCCTQTSGGHAYASSTLSYKGSLVLNVFKATFAGYRVTFCRQAPSGTYCYSTATNTELSFSVTSNPVPTALTLGLFSKGGEVVRIINTALVASGAPVWNTPGDIQFHGYDDSGIPVYPIHGGPNGVQFGPWVGTGCADPSIAPHNAWKVASVIQPPPGINLMESISTYPPFQNNGFDLRVRNATLRFNSGLPEMSLFTEYFGTSAVGAITMNYRQTLSKYDFSNPAISAISFSGCNAGIGDTLNSHCLLTIVWADTSVGFALTLESTQPDAIRPVSNIIVSPHQATYLIRVLCYKSTTSIGMNIYVQGQKLATINNIAVVMYDPLPTQSSSNIQDVNYSFSSGNLSPTATNLALLIVSILSFVLSVGFAIGFLVCACQKKRQANAIKCSVVCDKKKVSSNAY
jgi:hypothetical protein